MAKLTGPRVVPDAKLARYLLDLDHPAGGAKARYFLGAGFSADRIDDLAAALLEHADLRDIASERVTSRGVSRRLRCTIRTPDGRNPCVFVVWFQAAGDWTHRLVTAYPAPAD